MIGLCAVFALLFAGLGIWQLQRLQWKLGLIAKVEQRIHAPAVPVPNSRSWKDLEPDSIEYRRVYAVGTFIHEKEALVDALTERGPGYWVLTPLQTADGNIIVNRGFVPQDRATPNARPEGHQARIQKVEGLLRITEPHGRYLRPNRPNEDKWYSRDIAAIAKARTIAVAPFFIDADAKPNPGGYPVGGMTVVRFRNTHLIYAVTWFGLAALAVVGLWLLRKPSRR
ncbi:SURF1 family protein [Sphingomonas edaphi]|uniref:SURF1-like protein n=1 Tax=Sphingomonas edaphi TaxID=2315689 RepID=A0A418PYS7_9SPHN|nr:SURF1 family protein [Sphingomonas edaphi]